MLDKPKENYRPTIRAHILHSILNHAKITPKQQEQLLLTEGLSTKNLYDYGAEIPLNSYMRLFERLSVITNVKTLGLNISKQMGPELVGAVGFIFLSSPNLKSAIEYYSNSVSSIQQETQLTFTNDDFPILQYVFSDDNIGPRRQDVEFSIGYLNGLLKKYIGESYSPKEIYFEHAKPVMGNIYEAFFDCPVFFEQSINAIILHPEDMEKGSAKFDKNLVPLLEHYLQLLEMNAYTPTSMAANINQLLPQCIEDGQAHIAYVAARLGFSETTIRRRLKNEGTTFRKLLVKKRVAMAKRFLSETDMSILQISQKTGYSETASFSRNFLKETGKTPSKFRKTLKKRVQF